MNEGKGVVFAFVNTCPRRSMITENGKPVFANEIMHQFRQGAIALEEKWPRLALKHSGDRREVRGPYCRCEYPD
jgi:hypothetical protein